MVPTRSDGAPTFYFSNPNVLYNVGGVQVRGSGHVSLTKHHDNWGEALHGFAEDKCEVKLVTGGGCDPEEVCVLKLSDETSGHVASCSQDNFPFEHDFGYTLCCTPEEYCRDGIDNTGDGLIDYASPECHPSPVNFEPQRCDPEPEYLFQGFGNFQQTSGCALDYDPLTDETIYDPRCIGVADDTLESGWFSGDPWPVGFPGNYDFPIVNQSYYCSYGVEDDGSQTGGMGFCCSPDTRAEINSFTGAVSCEPWSECGVMPDTCIFDPCQGHSSTS